MRRKNPDISIRILVVGAGLCYLRMQSAIGGVPDSAYFVGIYVDPNSDISEASETNNTLSSSTQLVVDTSAEANDATLASLSTSIGSLSPTFDPSVTVYSVSVANSVDIVTLSASANDPDATVAGDGALALSVGANAFAVVVTAADGVSTETYNLTITRATATTGNDASLSSITLDIGTLSPVFDPAISDYSATVANSVASVTVTAVPTDGSATVSGDGLQGLSVGSNIVSIDVVSADATASLTYIVTITRASATASNDATLASLSLSAGSLSPTFSSATYSYSASVANGVTSTTVSATPNDTAATVSGDGTQGLVVGTNTVVISVLAEDGTTLQNYTIIINRQVSSPPPNDASLGSLSLSAGVLTPAFIGSTHTYTASVQNSVSSVIVTAMTNAPAASLSGDGVHPLSVGPNTVTIDVVSEDLSMFETYTITITRAAPSASNDATLAALSLSAGVLTPVFDAATTTYTASVVNSVASVTVTAAANNAAATISGDGVQALIVGANVLSVVVTAEDGTSTQTYTVVVDRAALSGNANLASITLDNGTLTPAFDPATTAYNASVLNAVSTITIGANAEDAAAAVSGAGTFALSVGANNFSIVVTAENSSTKSYLVTVTRQPLSTDATLGSLGLSVGTLTPSFAPATHSYSASVANTVTAVNISAAPNDSTASLVGDGAQALSTGPNAFNIVVTAEDGVTTLTYTVTLTRAYATDATLSDLTLSSGTLSPAFVPASADYSASVANSVTNVTINATPNDSAASVAGAGSQSLTTGDNVIDVVVTAEDGTTTFTYRITITRAFSADATLSSLSVSPGTLTPAFASATTTYAASVTNATINVNISATSNDPGAVVIGTGVVTIAVGANTFNVVVTAEDGTTILTYTIVITRLSASPVVSHSVPMPGTAPFGYAGGGFAYGSGQTIIRGNSYSPTQYELEFLGPFTDPFSYGIQLSLDVWDMNMGTLLGSVQQFVPPTFMGARFNLT